MLSRPGSRLPINSCVLRPMMIGLPQVSSRKRFRSRDSRQGKPRSSPMTWLRPIAAMIERGIRASKELDGHLAAQRGMVLIPLQADLLKLDAVDVRDRIVQHQASQGIRVAAQLLAHLLKMILVHMPIA